MHFFNGEGGQKRDQFRRLGPHSYVCVITAEIKLFGISRFFVDIGVWTFVQNSSYSRTLSTDFRAKFMVAF